MKDIELYVRGVVKDAVGETVVVVVPNNRLPIKVGDVLRLKYEVEEQTRDDIVNGLPPIETRLNAAQIDLMVEKIDVMRQLVEQLPAGVTGGLYLSGSGLAHVVPKCFLRTDPSI
jgi:hypothetical protein